MKVLVAESEEALAGPLRRAGHEVTVAIAAHDIRELTASRSFDAVVLGMMRPETQSLALCHTLRRDGIGVPIVLFVSGDAVEERIAGLEAGADQCLGVGCPNEELLARLRALVRRSLSGSGTT
jgi:DNA-binding response OmpR family regulator